MEINHLPKVSFEAPETDCCPPFEVGPWDEKEFVFKDKLFVKATVLEFMHIPLRMGTMVENTWQKITEVDAKSPDEFVMLSYDPSPWLGEHYFLVTKEVPDTEMVKISGTFFTKVFEGPYHDAPKWIEEMNKYVESKGEKAQKVYFYYTTCPRCAKHYGKNYVVAFAQIN